MNVPRYGIEGVVAMPEEQAEVEVLTWEVVKQLLSKIVFVFVGKDKEFRIEDLKHHKTYQNISMLSEIGMSLAIG